MGYTFDGGKNLRVPSSEKMWGSRVETVSPSVLRVDTVTSPAPDLIQVSFIEASSKYSLGDVKDEALASIRAINDRIEADIAYFNTLGGLAIAMNKLAIIKQDLNKVMTGLERI